MVSPYVRNCPRLERALPVPAALGFQAKITRSGKRIASRVPRVGSMRAPNSGSASTKITAVEPVSVALFAPDNAEDAPLPTVAI